MRSTIGTMAMFGAGLAAVFGTAGVATAQVAPVSLTATPLLPVVAGVRTPLLQSLVPGGSIERTSRLTSALRLRVNMANAMEGPQQRVHQRIASSMVDFYPVGASGFHLSAGARLYDTRIGEGATNRGLMGPPRIWNVPNARIGLRRTPAVTMGYTGQLAGGTSLGIEAGAMQGRAYNDATISARRLSGDRSFGNPLNPMVNLVIGRRF